MICKEHPAPTIIRGQGSGPSSKWSKTLVGYRQKTNRRGKKLKTLRKRIDKHPESAAHGGAVNLYEHKKANSSKTQTQFEDGWIIYEASTEHLFRLAYIHAKLDKLFTDFPHHVDCRKLNGADMDSILHSTKCCQSIITSISSDMHVVLCKHILEQGLSFQLWSMKARVSVNL